MITITSELRASLEKLAAINYNLYLAGMVERADTGELWSYENALEEIMRWAAEREALARAAALHSIAHWVDKYIGASSEHLFQHMTGGDTKWGSYPSDGGDRGRCVALLQAIPEWVERLDEMKQYKGWEDQIPLIREALTQTSNTDL